MLGVKYKGSLWLRLASSSVLNLTWNLKKTPIHVNEGLHGCHSFHCIDPCHTRFDGNVPAGPTDLQILSANHPYLQPKGGIAKGAAQRDRLNACERRLWQAANSHE